MGAQLFNAAQSRSNVPVNRWKYTWQIVIFLYLSFSAPFFKHHLLPVKYSQDIYIQENWDLTQTSRPPVVWLGYNGGSGEMCQQLHSEAKDQTEVPLSDCELKIHFQRTGMWLWNSWFPPLKADQHILQKFHRGLTVGGEQRVPPPIEHAQMRR